MATPLKTFEVDLTRRPHPAQFTLHHGETWRIRATITASGTAFDLEGSSNGTFYWQSQDMGDSWYSKPATIDALNSAIEALWDGAEDTGKDTFVFFFCFTDNSTEGKTYQAGGSLRMMDSPGWSPNPADLPHVTKNLDFSQYNLINAPWIETPAVAGTAGQVLTYTASGIVWADAGSVSGYATQDWVRDYAYISSGTITIGANSITPLTEHQSLAGYAQLGASQTFTAKQRFSAGATVSNSTYAWDVYLTYGGDFAFYNGVAEIVFPSGLSGPHTVAMTSDIPSVPTAYTSDPAMDGTASAGSSTSWAKGDHVHPTDTTRQAKVTASGILKADGNGGVSAAVAGTDYQAPLTFDNSPTANSNNPVKSGGIKTALDGKSDEYVRETAGTSISTGNYILADHVANLITPTSGTATATCELPTPSGDYLIDLYIDVDNTANSSDLGIEFAGLGASFGLVCREDETLEEITEVAAGDRARLLITETSFTATVGQDEVPVYQVAQIALGSIEMGS